MKKEENKNPTKHTSPFQFFCVRFRMIILPVPFLFLNKLVWFFVLKKICWCFIGYNCLCSLTMIPFLFLIFTFLSRAIKSHSLYIKLLVGTQIVVNLFLHLLQTLWCCWEVWRARKKIVNFGHFAFSRSKRGIELFVSGFLWSLFWPPLIRSSSKSVWKSKQI